MCASSAQPEQVDLIERLKGQKVAKEEVARYYIRSEMSRLLPAGQSFSTDYLEGQPLWRLLEALSHTLRLNSVFSYVTNEGVDWFKLSVPVNEVTLTGMSPAVSKLIYSDGIDCNPDKLRGYLTVYFANHPDDDPEGLEECRPLSIPEALRAVIIRKDGDKNKLLDGSHRFMSQLMSGVSVVPAYYCQPNGRPRKTMVGDASIYLLRRLYVEAGTDDDKAAILNVVKMMMNTSSDGQEAVRQYWLEQVREDDIKAAGKKLLSDG